MRTLMVKVNDRYIPEYQTVTKIAEDENGQRFSVKIPLMKAATAHIRQMKEASEALDGTFSGLSVVPCRMEGDKAVFPFLEGRTLLEVMAESVHKGKEAFLQLWDDYVTAVRSKPEYTCVFKTTPEFEHFFGDGQKWTGKPAYSVCSLDMLPSNIMVQHDGKKVLFDYEWLLRVPVPISLVIYQAIFFCMHMRTEFAPVVSMEELLLRAGINEDDVVLHKEAVAQFHRVIGRRKPEDPSVNEVYARYRKPVNDPAMFESEYYRLLSQLREEEIERLNIIDGWNREHAHAIEIDKERVSLLEERDRLLAESAGKQEALEGLRVEYAQQQEAFEGLRGEYAQQQEALEGLRGEYAQQQEAFEGLRGEYAQQQETLEGLRGEYAQQQETLEGLQGEYAQQQEALEGLQGEYAQQQETLEGLQGEYAQQQETLEGLQGEYAQQQEAFEGLQAEYAQQQEAFEGLQAEYAQQQETLEKQKTECAKLLTQLHEGTERMKSLQQDLTEVEQVRRSIEVRLACGLDREDLLHIRLYECHMREFALYSQLCAAQGQLYQAQQECNALRQSTSWKITAPLRRLSGWVRRLLHRR